MIRVSVIGPSIGLIIILSSLAWATEPSGNAPFDRLWNARIQQWKAAGNKGMPTKQPWGFFLDLKTSPQGINGTVSSRRLFVITDNNIINKMGVAFDTPGQAGQLFGRTGVPPELGIVRPNDLYVLRRSGLSPGLSWAIEVHELAHLNGKTGFLSSNPLVGSLAEVVHGEENGLGAAHRKKLVTKIEMLPGGETAIYDERLYRANELRKVKEAEEHFGLKANRKPPARELSYPRIVPQSTSSGFNYRKAFSALGNVLALAATSLTFIEALGDTELEQRWGAGPRHGKSDFLDSAREFLKKMEQACNVCQHSTKNCSLAKELYESKLPGLVHFATYGYASDSMATGINKLYKFAPLPGNLYPSISSWRKDVRSFEENYSKIVKGMLHIFNAEASFENWCKIGVNQAWVKKWATMTEPEKQEYLLRDKQEKIRAANLSAQTVCDCYLRCDFSGFDGKKVVGPGIVVSVFNHSSSSTTCEGLKGKEAFGFVSESNDIIEDPKSGFLGQRLDRACINNVNYEEGDYQSVSATVYGRNELDEMGYHTLATLPYYPDIDKMKKSSDSFYGPSVASAYLKSTSPPYLLSCFKTGVAMNEVKAVVSKFYEGTPPMLTFLDLTKQDSKPKRIEFTESIKALPKVESSDCHNSKIKMEEAWEEFYSKRHFCRDTSGSLTDGITILNKVVSLFQDSEKKCSSSSKNITILYWKERITSVIHTLKQYATFISPDGSKQTDYGNALFRWCQERDQQYIDRSQNRRKH